MDLLQFVELNNYGTDKIDLGYIEGFYDRLFSPRKDSAQNILEIGVYHGNSIIMWRDYFQNAIISGVDHDYCQAISRQSRIVHTVTNAYSDSFISQLKDNHYDIIIDDGPHTFDSMVVYLTKYLSKVKVDGLLILEDIIDTNWTPMLLSLVQSSPKNRVELVHMANRQRNPVLNSTWARGLDIIIVEKLAD